jgi:hypothetical protein
MSVWQRGTSAALAAGGVYFADRFQGYRSTAGATASRQLTNDTTNLPNIQYCSRIQRDSGNTGTQTILISQSFETVNSIPLAGRTVTMSFYARCGANYSPTSSLLTAQLFTGTGTDQNAMMTGYTGSAATISQTPTLTTTWQRFSYSATIPVATTEMAPYFTFTPVGTAGVNDYYEITGLQVEVGSVATPFETELYGETLVKCQRYYYRAQPAGAGRLGPTGAFTSTTNAFFIAQFPVTMRTLPSSIEFGTLTAYDYATDLSLTALTITAGGSTTSASLLTATVASGGTQFRPIHMAGAGGAGFYALSAEL